MSYTDQELRAAMRQYANAQDEILRELYRARQRFGPMKGPHEGYAVLLEEVDELWDAIKCNNSKGKLRAEATQIAAMALAFMVEVCSD